MNLKSILRRNGGLVRQELKSKFSNEEYWKSFILYAFVAVGLVLLFTTPKVHANDSHCYSIKNSDQKNYCLALAKHQHSYCYSIHESDAKNLCLAQIKNQKSYCYSIKSSDSKNQCLALVK
jgi:hypothetical protein